MAAKLTSFLTKLIEAIEDARVHESQKWYKSKHFKALESCLEEAQELLQFELTRAPTQQENQPKVSQNIGHDGVVTRQSEAKQRISLPDEVLNVIFSYFKDTRRNPRNLSSNAYNFSLVCKSWHRVANRRLWQNVHLLNSKSTVLFARSLNERRRQKGLPLSIGDGIRGLHVHFTVNIYIPDLFTYVFDCVKLFTKNIVSLNLVGLSTEWRPLKLTEFYEIFNCHPHLKHVRLFQIAVDSVEPRNPLPQLETFYCAEWMACPEVETLFADKVGELELISAKTIFFTDDTAFKKDSVKSVYCNDLPLFQQQANEYKQVTHLHLSHSVDPDVTENSLIEGFRSIREMAHLSFLALNYFTHPNAVSFDLIAEHFSLTTFVIAWQPGEDSLHSWVASIRKMGPRLLSVGVGLEKDKYLAHPCILQAIYQNCPNLMTLEFNGFDSPSDAWPFQSYTSELENLCRLPLKWIYAPWFLEWPQKWKDSCPKFAKLCRLGLDVGLYHYPDISYQLFDYTQSMRPAIIGDGFT